MFKRYDSFHVDPKLFPENSRKAFPTALIIRAGVLPLGFKTGFSLFGKKRYLNVGLLSPGKTNIAELKKAAWEFLGKEAFDRLHLYRIEAKDLVGILETAYGVKSHTLGSIPEKDTHPHLREFLEKQKSEGN